MYQQPVVKAKPQANAIMVHRVLRSNKDLHDWIEGKARTPIREDSDIHLAVDVGYNKAWNLILSLYNEVERNNG